MKPDIVKILDRYKINFVVFTLLAIAAFDMIYMLNPQQMNHALDNFDFNLILLILALAVFISASISYPRVYKLKVLLSGYALAAMFLNFLMITNRMPFSLSIMGLDLNVYVKAATLPDKFSLKIFFWLFNLNLLMVLLAPSHVTYAAGKRLAAAVFFGNIALYVTLIYVFNAYNKDFPFMEFLRVNYRWINIFILALIAGLSFLHIEEEHNYGSIIASMALILMYASTDLAWNSRIKLLMIVMAVILIIGIFYHWLGSLLHKANYDPLLKIYNRQYMGGILDGIVDINLKENFSVMLCDIDHFKMVNDTHGHMAGDAVLFAVAQAIKDSALPEGVVCRYGGEEILVFLRDLTGAQAFEKAEKVRKAVKKISVPYKGKNIKVNLSIGLASCKGPKPDLEALIKKADDAVYKAKKTGRDKTVSAD